MSEQKVREYSDTSNQTRTACPGSAKEPEHFSDRLKIALGDGSVRSLSRKSGVGEKSIRGYLSASSEPKLSAFVALAEALKVSVEWLAAGHKGPGAGNRHIDDSDSEFVGIPQYDVEVAAGHGSLPGAETIVSRYAFRRDWIRSKGWSPDQLAIVINRGDSQEGVVDDGQPVLINLADHDIYKEGLFVIRQDDWLMLKIVQMDMQGNALIRSNNPLYREIQVPSNQISTLNIIGRAVWTDRLL